MFDDGHGGLLVGHEPFLQTLLVIIRPPTTRLPSLQTARRADLLAALEEQNALQVHLLPHLLGPASQVVLVPGEAVDEEIIFVTLSHSPLQKTAGDLYRNNCTVGNMVLYQLSKLKTEGSVMKNKQACCQSLTLTSDPGLALSPLSKSPAERWTYPNSLTILKTKHAEMTGVWARLFKGSPFTLSSLACPWSTEDEDNVRFAHYEAPEMSRL